MRSPVSRCLIRTLRTLLRRRSSALASAAYTDPARKGTQETTSTPSGLTSEQRDILTRAIRVDQAGEVAANTIYTGQLCVLGRDPIAGPLIETMREQEQKHLKVMNLLQAQHRVRPTILWDVARAAGWGLGAVTALMGKEAAMACTEAVETAIGEHYDDQLKELESLPQGHPSISLLREVIEEFRDDELEHLDTAIEHDSQKAPGHALLSAVILKGCEAAIEACKRI